MFIAAAATFCSLILTNASSSPINLAKTLSERLSVKNFLLLTFFLVVWTGIHHLSGIYMSAYRTAMLSYGMRALAAVALGSVFFFVFPLFSRERSPGIFAPVLVFFVVASFGSLLLRWVLWPFVIKTRSARQRPLRLIIVGSGPLAARFHNSLARLDRPYKVLGFVDLPGPHTTAGYISDNLIGTPGELDSILMTTAVDEVAIALPVRSCYDAIQAAISDCERTGVPVTYHSQVFRHTIGFSQHEERAHQPFVAWSPSRLVELQIAKRALDVVGALTALILLSPLLILIGLANKILSPGPIVFSQERYGLNKRKFRMYKFRTMVTNAEALQQTLEAKNEATGPVFKMKNDPRITPFGRFLRKTSLDELPQLLNVLKGDMSLVGPRPLPNRDVARFSDPCLMRRFSVKPGLTCLWQVRGRSDTTFDQWIAYDLEYIDNWSFTLDAQILILTVLAIFRGTGAF